MDVDQAQITLVLRHYFPGWEPPENVAEWNSCLCPAHDESRPSCRVSFDIGAVKCQACGFVGNVVSIVQAREGVSYPEAVKRAEAILVDGGQSLPAEHAGKSRRRSARRSGPRRGSREIRPWLRS